MLIENPLKNKYNSREEEYTKSSQYYPFVMFVSMNGYHKNNINLSCFLGI